MSRVFLKNLNFFFEKLKILLYNMKNISERYGGYRMGIFIVAIFLGIAFLPKLFNKPIENVNNSVVNENIEKQVTDF